MEIVVLTFFVSRVFGVSPSTPLQCWECMVPSSWPTQAFSQHCRGGRRGGGLNRTTISISIYSHPPLFFTRTPHVYTLHLALHRFVHLPAGFVNGRLMRVSRKNKDAGQHPHTMHFQLGPCWDFTMDVLISVVEGLKTALIHASSHDTHECCTHPFLIGGGGREFLSDAATRVCA